MKSKVCSDVHEGNSEVGTIGACGPLMLKLSISCASFNTVGIEECCNECKNFVKRGEMTPNCDELF